MVPPFTVTLSTVGAVPSAGVAFVTGCAAKSGTGSFSLSASWSFPVAGAA